jgi:hypothetical protein
MPGHSLDIKFKLNYQTVLVIVIVLHALFFSIRHMPRMTRFTPPRARRDAIQIKNFLTDSDMAKVRTVGAKDSKSKNSTYLQKTNSKTQEVSKDIFAPDLNRSAQQLPPPKPQKKGAKDLSLKDLAMGKQQTPVAPNAPAKTTAPQSISKLSNRPGTRPTSLSEKPKAIEAIALNGAQMKQFVQGSSAAALSGDPRAESLSNSDIMVNLEVPEGVNPDELNKYELMFYGFQRRTAIGYINSFYKKLDKFQSENPHLNFPMTDTKQLMTGKLTFDGKGNIVRIQMVRTSNEKRLQGFFEDVLKDMDTLHNPPQALWSKSGEFSIFFTLVING